MLLKFKNRYLGLASFAAFIFCLFFILIFQLVNPQKVKATSLIGDTPVNKSVFLLIFNPIIESQNNQRLTQVENWGDPQQITDGLLTALPSVSHGYINYTITQTVVVDGIFPKSDGYQYTDASYLACINGTGACHQPDIIDYQSLFNAYNICSQNVDEVWLWGGPYFGYWEYNPVSFCGKTTFVMGFNYERALAEALHDFGHRMEFIGTNRVGDGNWVQNEANEWNKYSLIAGHCRNVHIPRVRFLRVTNTTTVKLLRSRAIVTAI